MERERGRHAGRRAREAGRRGKHTGRRGGEGGKEAREGGNERKRNSAQRKDAQSRFRHTPRRRAPRAVSQEGTETKAAVGRCKAASPPAYFSDMSAASRWLWCSCTLAGSATTRSRNVVASFVACVGQPGLRGRMGGRQSGLRWSSDACSDRGSVVGERYGSDMVQIWFRYASVDQWCRRARPANEGMDAVDVRRQAEWLETTV